MIEKNDPRLTEFVLDELDADARQAVEKAVGDSPELQAAMAEIRQATESLSVLYQNEPEFALADSQKERLLELAAAPEIMLAKSHPLSDSRVPGGLVVAATTMLLLGLYVLSQPAPINPGLLASREADGSQSEPIASRVELKADVGNAAETVFPADIQVEPMLSAADLSSEQHPLIGLVVSPRNEVELDERAAEFLLESGRPQGAFSENPVNASEPESETEFAVKSTGSNSQPTSIEASLREVVISQADRLLKQSSLVGLRFDISTRSVPGKLVIQRSEKVLVQRAINRVGADQDGELKNALETLYLSDQQPTSRETDVQFVEPVVRLAAGEPEALVERLAKEIDPEGNAPISLEQLIGLDGLLAIDGDLESALASRPMTGSTVLDRGYFARQSKVGSQLDRATFALALKLNATLSSAPQADAATSDVSESELEQSLEGLAPTASAGAAKEIQPDRIVQPLAQKVPHLVVSLDELDLTGVIEQLQRATAKRNERIRNNRSNPNE